jgi:hypothetical protein
VQDAGGPPVLVAPKTGKVQAFNHLDKGDVRPAMDECRTPGGFDLSRTVDARRSRRRRRQDAHKLCAVTNNIP